MEKEIDERAAESRKENKFGNTAVERVRRKTYVGRRVISCRVGTVEGFGPKKGRRKRRPKRAFIEW